MNFFIGAIEKILIATERDYQYRVHDARCASPLYFRATACGIMEEGAHFAALLQNYVLGAGRR